MFIVATFYTPSFVFVVTFALVTEPLNIQIEIASTTRFTMHMLTRSTKICFCLRNPRLISFYLYLATITLDHSMCNHASIADRAITINEVRFAFLTSLFIRLTMLHLRHSSLWAMITACRCKMILTLRISTATCLFIVFWLKRSWIRDESLRPQRLSDRLRLSSCQV